MLKSFDSLVPDSYVHNIYEIRYGKLYQNGIQYAVFDVDSTIVPFDSIKMEDEHKILFDYINKEIGMNVCLCSTGTEKRVKPVGEFLNIPYLSKVKKPFFNFRLIKDIFGDDCNPYNTMLIGDSLFLDMIFASRYHLYKILVDDVKDGFNLKGAVLNAFNLSLAVPLKKRGFQYKKVYYHGYKEQ